MDFHTIIQEFKDDNGTFNKHAIARSLRRMSQDDFDKACERHLKLEHHHATTVGLYATDLEELAGDQHFQITDIGGEDVS